MQRPTYGISNLATTTRRDRTYHHRTQLAICISLAPRPMTVVFGLGTKLRVRMRTTLENGVLRNGQQPGRAENSFIDQGEFVAMKTLSGCKALRCDKRQFRD